MKIVFHNWWGGFFDGKDPNNISFFAKLFSHSELLKNFSISEDMHNSEVLFVNDTVDISRFRGNFRYRINYIGEPRNTEGKEYDMVIIGSDKSPHFLYLPLSVIYTLGNNFYDRLLWRPKCEVIPPKFCCFIVSNPKCIERNVMFHLLNEYKRVDSYGRYANNMGMELINSSWCSENYFRVISQYKFMICFENTKIEKYSTEKIVNAYLGNAVPIYWGTADIANIFNPESMLYLEDGNKIREMVETVKMLDNNDEMYLRYRNARVLNEHNVEFWKQNFTLEYLGKKMDTILLKL